MKVVHDCFDYDEFRVSKMVARSINSLMHIVIEFGRQAGARHRDIQASIWASTVAMMERHCPCAAATISFDDGTLHSSIIVRVLAYVQVSELQWAHQQCQGYVVRMVAYSSMDCSTRQTGGAVDEGEQGQ